MQVQSTATTIILLSLNTAQIVSRKIKVNIILVNCILTTKPNFMERRIKFKLISMLRILRGWTRASSSGRKKNRRKGKGKEKRKRKNKGRGKNKNKNLVLLKKRGQE